VLHSRITTDDMTAVYCADRTDDLAAVGRQLRDCIQFIVDIQYKNSSQALANAGEVLLSSELQRKL